LLKGPCLRNTAVAARTLALIAKVPLIGVNHCVAHIEIGRLASNVEDAVTLYVSGGNTIVAAYSEGRYRVFGETLDIPVGNLLDAFARTAGLQHPGGPKIESLARKGRQFIELPYTVKGMDLSYSGLLTAVTIKLQENRLEDLCFSLQEVAFSMLTEVTERALAHTEKPAVLLTGGVAANKRLQEMCRIMCEERGAKFFVPSNEFLQDNAAMIAFLGEIMFKKGIFVKGKNIEKLDIKPRERTDDVVVRWK